MKGWFNENGDIELENGMVIYDPIPMMPESPFGGDSESIPISFKVETEKQEKEYNQ